MLPLEVHGATHTPHHKNHHSTNRTTLLLKSRLPHVNLNFTSSFPMCQCVLCQRCISRMTFVKRSFSTFVARSERPLLEGPSPSGEKAQFRTTRRPAGPNTGQLPNTRGNQKGHSAAQCRASQELLLRMQRGDGLTENAPQKNSLTEDAPQKKLLDEGLTAHQMPHDCPLTGGLDLQDAAQHPKTRGRQKQHSNGQAAPQESSVSHGRREGGHQQNMRLRPKGGAQKLQLRSAFSRGHFPALR